MKLYFEKDGVELYQGDVKQGLPFPDGSVDCVVTSPPYWGLRDYGTAQWEGGNPECDHGVKRWEGKMQTQGAQSGHAAKNDRLSKDYCECGAKRISDQIGLEETPEQYLDIMVKVFREVWRVLKPEGTLWLNIGDSYASTPAGNKELQTNQRVKAPNTTFVFGGNKQKGIPKGYKPKDLMGMPWRLAFALQADGWWLRQDIIWHKPNPMPESTRDRCTKSHEYIFLLAKSGRYYYDQDAIREPVSDSFIKRWGTSTPPRKNASPQGVKADSVSGESCMGANEKGANKRSVWTVTSKPFSGAHFATFPPDLIEPCILAGCPKGGIVLDLFNGSGTTGMVSRKHGRQYRGVDLFPEYLKMSVGRIFDRVEASTKEELEDGLNNF